LTIKKIKVYFLTDMEMDKNRIDANVRCPSCNGQLYPRVLVCDACGLKVEGEFVLNEFGSLTPDELHFLRVFIYCEGRIRDMEAALGVSYPTVKSHLASIKKKLNLTGPRAAHALGAAQGASGASDKGTEEFADDVLGRLENGSLSYKDAVKLLKDKIKDGKKEEKDGDKGANGQNTVHG
jgi:hypothetical protein